MTNFWLFTKLICCEMVVVTFPWEVLTYPAMVKLRLEATPTVPLMVLLRFRFSVTTGVGATVRVFSVRAPVTVVEPESR